MSPRIDYDDHWRLEAVCVGTNQWTARATWDQPSPASVVVRGTSELDAIRNLCIELIDHIREEQH